jgi:hypothetical protein
MEQPPKEPVNDPQAMDEAPDEPPSYNPLMHQPIVGSVVAVAAAA